MLARMPRPAARRTPAEIEELRRQVHALSWHHQIDLGDGILTPGRDRSARKLAELRLPPLAGRSVLDVGAWDGYFSFAAEADGASRVMATDSVMWRDVPGCSKVPFETARAALGSRVEDRFVDVLDLDPEPLGTWDVVLFLGVLYHMRDPMLALERVASVTGDLLVLETLSDAAFSRRPLAAFYPGSTMNGDESNWWGPNAAAVVGMLEGVGFRDVRVISGTGLGRRAGRLLYNAANVAHSRASPSRTSLPWSYVQTDRLIVHARR